MKTKVACIGSRTVPRPLWQRLWNLGRLVAGAGWLVATGNARGADQLFAAGASSLDPGLVRLFLPWAKYEQRAIHPRNRVYVAWGERYRQIAAALYGVWRRMNPPTGGGYGQAVRVASGLNVRPEELRPTGRQLPGGPEFAAPPAKTYQDLSNGAQRLMARNVAIVEHSELVLAYPSLEKSWGGGTGFGIRVALRMGIPVVDLSRGRGLGLLMRLVEALPWPESQDAFLELLWFHRAGGVWPRDVYEDRMQAAVRVLLWDLSRLSAPDMAAALERLPASLLWSSIDGVVPVADVEEGDPEFEVRVRVPDPISLRTLLPYQPPRDEEAPSDPEAPETELWAMLRADDTGNPLGDRFRHEATLHDGQRRWYEACLVMPSGIVLKDVPAERTRDALLARLDVLSWGWFRQSLWRLQPGDQALFLTLRKVLLELELRGSLLDDYLRDLDQEILARKEQVVGSKAQRARDAAAHLEALAEAARSVLGEHVARLQAIATAIGPSDAEPESVVLDWQDIRERVRLRYPTAPESLVDFAVARGRELWAVWAHTLEGEEVVTTPDLEGEEAEPGELVISFTPHRKVEDAGVPFRGTSRVVIGHLWKALEPWEARRPRKLVELLEALRSVRSRKDLALLEVRAGEWSGTDRRVLDTHIRLARQRVAFLHRRRYAHCATVVTQADAVVQGTNA